MDKDNKDSKENMPAYFCHQSAIVETDQIGEGTRIWAFSHIRPSVKIGGNCNIGDHCFIEDHVTLGEGVTIKNGVTLWKGVELKDYVFVGPNAAFTNDLFPRSLRCPYVNRSNESDWLVTTSVEEGASIGANSTILCGLTLGSYCLVGAGSVVTKDVAPYEIVAGNPARHKGFICRCGTRLQKQLENDYRCSKCSQVYRTLKEGLGPL